MNETPNLRVLGFFFVNPHRPYDWKVLLPAPSLAPLSEMKSSSESTSCDSEWGVEEAIASSVQALQVLRELIPILSFTLLNLKNLV